MGKRIFKIGIVDDNRMTLQSLTELITYNKQFEVVLTATNGQQFLDKMANAPATMIPDVVLMDIDMKIMNGIDAILHGKTKYPQVKYLVLTVFDDEENLFDSIKAGANGYLLKDEKMSVIFDHLINVVLHDFAPMSPSIAKKAFNLLSRVPKENQTKSILFEGLSEREVEVLQLLIEGRNYKKIAETLFISINTVKKHISHIYEKLHVSSKVQIMKLMNK
ncbi:MAG TPA: response regulator transcription factor [Saprospiraceae bacterium]|nr:response regulator transcription factor [Saprospiraceae bacterium]HPN70364.1 response regulator transcription factor [Saprospiraceae bacterium]